MIARSPRHPWSHISAVLIHTYAWGAGLAFAGSMAYFLYFYAVRLSEAAGHTARLHADGSGGSTALAIDLALYAAFAAHHSVMARAWAKRWVSGLVTPALERATYVWDASLLFFALCFFWRRLPGTLYDLEGLAAWPFRLAQIAGVALVASSARTIDVFALSGIRQTGRPPQPDRAAPHEMGRLETGGPYRLVRHPIYLGTMALLAGTPEMTADRLLFTTLSLAYLVIGIAFEERSLRVEFGAEYDQYTRAVRWRLLPKIY